MNQHLQQKNKLKSLKSAGFTLVELMIAIVLGLLIVAAATDLFLGGMVSLRLQQGGADAQDNGLFGLDYVAKDIRLTNYGNPQNLVLNDKTINGGIILTADTSPAASTANLTDVRKSSNTTDYVSPGWLTRGPAGTVGSGANDWKGLTKVVSPSTTKSDQLTFQFIAPVATTDCEGNNVNAGVRVVERLFLRADVNDANSLVLACDAGFVTPGVAAIPAAGATPAVPAVPPILTNIGDAGQVVMNHVEHFHVLLGTQKADGTLVYYSISDYLGVTTNPKPQIVSVQMAVLVRSSDNTSSAAIDPTQTFKMLNQNVTVATADSSANHYVRRVYSTTIALRNGFGSAS